MKRSTQISLAAVIVVALFVSLNAGTASAKSRGNKGGSHKVSAKKNSGKHRHNRSRFSKNRSHRWNRYGFYYIPSFETELYAPADETVELIEDADATLAEADPGIEVEFGARTHRRHNFRNHRTGGHGQHASRGAKGGSRHG